MISKKDIIEAARRITHQSRGGTVRKLMHPQRDWLIGVGLFMLIALLGGVINAQIHVYYSNLADTIVDETRPIKPYRSDSAKTALEMYEARLADFTAITASRPPVVIESEIATTTNATSSPVSREASTTIE